MTHWVSPVTGNTVKIAEGARDVLEEMGWGVARLIEGQKHPDDTYVLYIQGLIRDYMPVLE